MKSSSVLFVGCGDLGSRAGSALLQRGWQVMALRRDISRLPAGFTPIAADYTAAGSLDCVEALAPDFVVATFNPFDRSVAGYERGFLAGIRNLLTGLGGHRPRHVLMASSTRVYAETQGGWVEEHSPLTQSDPWAGAIIGAEQLLQRSGLAASIVRFAGIYGIPGGRLLARISRGELCAAQPLRYTNRIHREDGSGLLCHLLERAARGAALAPVYIGADDLPAPRYEVETWLARQLGVVVRPPDGGEPVNDPTRENSGHKRCANRALHASGYSLRYPDYRAGYAALLQRT